MIAPDIVAEIRRLLKEDALSQRKIARRIGVARGTVVAIASGRRRDRTALPPKEDEWAISDDPPQRCPACGVMVHMPCLLCRLRKKQAEGRLKKPHIPNDRMPLALELRPEHYDRYVVIHERKQREPEEAANSPFSASRP